MSSVTNQDTTHNVYGGVVVDVVEEGIPRVQRILAGINGGWQKAVGSALARAASVGKTAAKKSVTSEYFISQSTFLHNTRNINHFREDAGGVSVEFGFAGHVIPLIQFSTRVNGSGMVTTQVKKNGVRESLNNAFQAQMGAHTGIYERIGPERFPVRELYGPATPQMMYSNEDVMDQIEDKLVGEYEKRIDHEMLRLMNGWGG